jgi:DnaJ-class molecular chaperone
MAKEIKVNKLYQGFEKEELIEVKINSKNVFGKDCYAILKIPRNAEKNTIRKAYLKLAPEYHPDKKLVRTPELDKK